MRGDTDDEGQAVATAAWGYLRLPRETYDDAALAAWANRVASQPWTEALAFFTHEDDGAGLKAARFADLAG